MLKYYKLKFHLFDIVSIKINKEFIINGHKFRIKQIIEPLGGQRGLNQLQHERNVRRHNRRRGQR